MYGFEDLKYQVIEKKLCSNCGTCSGVCPRVEIDENPHLVDRCTYCGMCYSFCHRVGFPKPVVEKKLLSGKISEFGKYIKAYSAKGKYTGQNGGVVTTLLSFMLDEKLIDAAVTVGDDLWKTKIVLAENSEQVLECRGSKYSITPVCQSLRNLGKRRIAFVGLPCQIESLRKIQLNNFYDLKIERVKVLIGLFCYENFTPQLLSYVEKNIAKLKDVERFDIDRGKLLIYTKDKVFEKSLKEIQEFVAEGCKPCLDFSAEYADISVGSRGSQKGFSTVILRSENGENLFEKVLEKGYFEVKDADLHGISKLTNSKKKKNEKIYRERRMGK